MEHRGGRGGRGGRAPPLVAHPPPPANAEPQDGRVARCWNLGIKEFIIALVVLFVSAIASAIVADMRVLFESRVESAVTSLRPITVRPVPRFVHRRVINHISGFLSESNRFLIVEGGIMMGKSVAVEMAIANLSTSRPVLRVEAKKNRQPGRLVESAGEINTTMAETTVQYLPNSPTQTHSVGDALLARLADGTKPIPVFVVEKAEFLDVEHTLVSIMDVAKEMIDRGTAKFVFVFAPTDKMDKIRHFGSLSRAKIFPVEDMTYAETREFLLLRGCPVERINVTYNLLDGHLSHFAGLDVMDPVSQLCRGDISVVEFEREMLLTVQESVRASVRGTQADACQVLCAIVDDEYSEPTFATHL